MKLASVLAPCAALMTLVVVLAARPVSAEPLPGAGERSRVECGVHRACCFPSRDRTDPLLRSTATRTHRAVVGIPQTAPGGLPHPVVKRFVAQHADELARCYPRRLPASTGHGQIGLSLVILPGGKVQLLGALGFDAEVTSCMARVIAGIEFPRSPRGDVTHTFVPITIAVDKR